MLTEEDREKGLLRQQRSSTETDEQILQYLKKKRASQVTRGSQVTRSSQVTRTSQATRTSQPTEEDDNVPKRTGSKITEGEEPLIVKDVDQLPQQGNLNGNFDKCEMLSYHSDISFKQDKDDEVPATKFCWFPYGEKKSSNQSNTASVTKFFVQRKSSEIGLKAKPPIYRNINEVYEFKSRLKKGAYITINKYYSTILKMDVAIKIIPKIGIPNKRLFKFVPRELDLAGEKTFRHPNIVHFLETHEIGLRIYIMMEYIETGNLTEFITARGRLDPTTYKSFFAQLINAVNYCLDYGICHRKLCTDNCLVTKDFVLKLCDFSYCRQIENRHETLNTFCGILGFTAPEILMCRGYKANMTESWSCGVILFTMIYGALPFDSSNFAKLLKQVMKPIKYHWYNDTPIDAVIIMYQCISPIKRRWSVQKILGHRWVTPPSTIGYENYMKWLKKRTRGPSIPVLRKKFKELFEVIKRDYVTPFNEEQEKLSQIVEEEEEDDSELESRMLKLMEEYMKYCEFEE